MRGTSSKGLLDPKEVAMTRRQFVGMAVLMAVALVGPATISTRAQEKQEKKPEERVSGTVEIINKETKTIVLQGTGGEAQKQLMYDEKTVVTKDNKPAKIEDVSSGQRLICVGHTGDKGMFLAHRIDIRPAH
jgi:hypothetical protein